ncbi:putative protein N(5)-glutamine methyltransferase [Metabacillus sp. GX 13764]|uniref:putative protein N(5)-glutamine methyltransferase n=1 Tax=Metabacillus kandeliae TaxID=2900151 RepID=UPI001E389865|nr:putative protein N(5)-glutamine methyltransferase [Metabacillus kandeliae]MCD7034152.1 putative protein N(5)-glutamine methyltransferase [Metabacillus kandeliae]
MFPSLIESNLIEKLRTAGSVFAEEEAKLLLTEAKSLEELNTMTDKRIAGMPLEYVIGWAEFCGHRIKVSPGVFVPRRRTEFLADQAAFLLKEDAVVLDLCCGTGAVGAVLASSQKIDLYAVDLDPAAVRSAHENTEAFGGKVFEGDLYAPLPLSLKHRFDLIAANAPYVPSGEIEFMPREARLHEERMALDGGGDGLDVQRRIAAEADQWLAPGGCLLIETSERQAPVTADIFARHGINPRIVLDDDLHTAVVIGVAR